MSSAISRYGFISTLFLSIDADIMKVIVLSLLAGWIIGIIFAWLKLPLPAPPPVGLVGAAGLTLGSIFYQWLRHLMGGAPTP